MNILISNDDGVDSPGLIALVEALAGVAEVTVVAPHRERSTSGHSLTLHKPLRIREVRPKHFSVTGTPADCVYVGTRFIMKSKPDLIVSGINRGANLGNDVYYSGTVAAAREGAHFGVKAIAFSLCFGRELEKRHLFWNTAANFAKVFVPQVSKRNFSSGHVLNCNIPNLSPVEIKGVKMSRLGRRRYDDIITEGIDPRGKPYYWLGGDYKGFDDIENSDCVHVNEGFISVVPLNTDSTDYNLLSELKNWEIDFQN